MKKITKMIIAAVTTISLSVGAGITASADCVDPEMKTVSLDRIGDSTKFNCYPNFGADILISNRAVKNCLVVGEDETLVIPKGKKMVLNKGARINGTLYIEEGGYLAVRGGRLYDGGKIVCDGTISVGEKAGMTIDRGSVFVVTELGTLKYSADDLLVSGTAEIACFGELNQKYLSDWDQSVLLAKPVCAVVGNSNGMVSATAEKTLNDYLADMTDYLTDFVNNGDVIIYVSFLMDNSSCIKMMQIGGETTEIATVDVGNLKMLAEETMQWVEEQNK